MSEKNRHTPPGTPFQQSVWREIAKIPRGQTITYKQLAERIGKPTAYRAVATACAANPSPGDNVPCHRVIASDGSLRGYSAAGGIARKRELLLSEGVKIAENKV